MRFNIEDFMFLPKWKLYFFGPSLSNIEDICLLTHSEINQIRHHVIGSDNNIYDAFALHTWLNTQYDKKFVIPGKEIDYVETTSWFWYSCCMLYRLKPSKIKIFSAFQKLTHTTKQNVETQTNDTQTKIQNKEATLCNQPTQHTKVDLHKVIKTIVKHKYTIKKKGNFTHSPSSSFRQITKLPHPFLERL